MKRPLTIAVVCLVAFTTQAQEFFEDANGKYGLKDQSGKVLVAGKYDEGGQFKEGLSKVMSYGKYNKEWGFIDKTGKEIK